MYGFLFFWIGGWNLAAAWYATASLTSRIVYYLGGLLGLGLTDTLYANGCMDGNMFEWEPLYAKGCWVLPARIAVSCASIPFMWVGLYELMAIHVPPNSYDTTLYGTPAVVAKDILLVVVGLAALVLSRTFFMNSFVPLEPSSDSCWARYSEPMQILPHHSGNRHTVAMFMAVVGIAGQSAFWLGLSDILENNSTVSLAREVVYICIGFMVYIMTRTVQARAYISVRGVPVEGMRPMKFGAATVLLAMISFTVQYVHLIGAWTALAYETIPWSTKRDCVYLVGGALLMVVSGTIRAHSGVGFAPMPGFELPFQSARSTRGLSVYEEPMSFWSGADKSVGKDHDHAVACRSAEVELETVADCEPDHEEVKLVEDH